MFMECEAHRSMGNWPEQNRHKRPKSIKSWEQSSTLNGKLLEMETVTWERNCQRTVNLCDGICQLDNFSNHVHRCGRNQINKLRSHKAETCNLMAIN